jgi:hypothetical protein
MAADGLFLNYKTGGNAVVLNRHRHAGWFKAWRHGFLQRRLHFSATYPGNLNENALPRNPKVEDISKADVLNGLKDARTLHAEL